MRTIYNLMLTTLLLGFAATAAHAQFEFAAKQPLQVQGTMAAPTLSSELALAGPDGSTYLLGAFDTEFEFAGKKITPGGTAVCSYLLKYGSDGSEQWGMYINGDTKVQAATMMGDNLMVAVRVRGAGLMVAADGVTSLPIPDDGFKVLMLLISPNGEPLGMKQLVAEETDELLSMIGFAVEPADLSIRSMAAVGNRIALAGNLTGLLKIDGVDIMESNKYDPFGMGTPTTPHKIAFMGIYDVSTNAFVRLDTIRPRINANNQVLLSSLSLAVEGDDVYWAVSMQDTVSCGDKIWDAPRTADDSPYNGLLLAKINATTGWVWDRLIVAESYGDKYAQPYVKPYAMEVAGDKLLMAGLFAVKADLGNGIVLNGLAPKLAADTTDFFFAMANTADGQFVDAFAFGGKDSSEVKFPDGLDEWGFDVIYRDNIQLATDGTSAFLMGAYKGELTTPAGAFNSNNGSVDNFLLRYNLVDKKWDGMSFGGSNDDYASSLRVVSDSLLVAGQYSGSIALSSAETLSSAGTGYNAFCMYYAQEQFKITLSAPANGTLLTSPVGGALAGRVVTITATPVSGYRLKEGSLKVYETGNPTNVVELSGNSFAMPRFAVTVEAEFEEEPIRSLNVSASPAEGGTISGQSTGNFDDGTAVTLTATPASGYRFVKWVEGATDISTDNPYTFSITADRTLVAVFEKITGLLDARIESLSVRPNPTKGALLVSVPELAEGTAAEVLVYNATGQLVLRIPAHRASTGSAHVSINLSGFPAGVYFVRVGNAAAKVVKM